MPRKKITTKCIVTFRSSLNRSHVNRYKIEKIVDRRADEVIFGARSQTTGNLMFIQANFHNGNVFYFEPGVSADDVSFSNMRKSPIGVNAAVV